MILVVTAGSVGVGTLIAGVAKDRVQAAVLINAVMIVMGIAGGTFFASSTGSPPLGPISLLTLNWWATEGFMKLAQTNVVPLQNVAALLIIFAVGFGLGLVLFRRHLDI
jgi:ABC-type multidrug transport system permease subunit